jgi:hypothetical protein
MSLVDALSPYLPEHPGLLPKWLLFVRPRLYYTLAP